VGDRRLDVFLVEKHPSAEFNRAMFWDKASSMSNRTTTDNSL